jgi:potassium efflux system protein
VVDTALGVLIQPLPNSNVSIASLLVFFVLATLVFTVAHYISVGLKQRFLGRLGLDLGTQESTAAIFKYVLTLLGILLVLPFSGLNLSSLAVIAGAVGLGIGFGLQNLSNNYISYLAILLERPIQIGDLVEVDNLLGTVEHIGPRATVLRTLDRIFVIVPNSRFTESKVVNWSYRDPRCRIHIPVGVAYGSDTKVVTEALLAVARGNPRVLTNPPPQVWLRSFGPSSLNFELLVWINRPQDQFVLISELNFAIEAEFRRRGIRIPFPQQDIHIRSLEGLVSLSRNGGSRSLPDAASIQSALSEAAQFSEDKD